MKSIKQMQEEREYLVACLQDINERADGPLSEDDDAAYRAGVDAVKAIDADIVRHNELVELAKAPTAVRGAHELDLDPVGEPGSVRDASAIDNPWDLDVARRAGVSELAARARTAAERASGLSDRQRETLTRFVDTLASDEDSRGASDVLRHIVTTSSPEYMREWGSAFRSALAGGVPDTRYLEKVKRAMSLTDGSGGYAIPQQLDPTLILTSDGTTNPIREIARKVTATGDVWNGLSTTHATWSWDGEAGEVSDDATTFAQPSITVAKAQGFIPFSIEIQGDYPNFTEDLQRVLARGRDDLEAAAFVTGTGTNQPIGIVTALTGGSYEVSSNSTDTFAVGDVYDLEEELPAKYRRNAQWTADKAIYNDIRQFGTDDGHFLWERIGAGQPPLLLGYPAHEASEMDGVINAGSENYVLILGDWENYVIADRIGMTLELVPHLFATGNNRPSGQRGFYAWYRVGADSVNDGAFRMLNVT